MSLLHVALYTVVNLESLHDLKSHIRKSVITNRVSSVKKQKAASDWWPSNELITHAGKVNLL